MPKTIRSSQHQRLLEILTDARLKAGLTQQVLAQKLGRPQSYVAKYENGERRLDLIEFVELVEAMDADPKKIFALFLQRPSRP